MALDGALQHSETTALRVRFRGTVFEDYIMPLTKEACSFLMSERARDAYEA